MRIFAKFKLFFLSILSLYIFSCGSFIVGIPVVNIPDEKGTIGSIDLPSPFFRMLRSWKEDTLVTIDSNARFAEMSFKGKSTIKIKPLVNYPCMALDMDLIAYPEYGLLIGKSARRFHVADIVSKKTKSFVPYLTGKHEEQSTPILIDGNEGFIIFRYRGVGYGIVYEGTNFFVVYNYKKDITTGKQGETEEDMRLMYPIDSNNIISFTNKRRLPIEVYIYNWRTGERTENELTKTLTRLDASSIPSESRYNINLEKRFLFVELAPISPDKSGNSWAKLTWKEGFKDVKVVPLDYLTPKERWLNDFFLSPDGQWATCLISGYEGLLNESLEKRVFFHMDDRYHNGISIPIFANGYYEYHWEQGAFVRHPVYGMCFAEENIKEDNFGVERRYLRLHKMDDVLAEINRQLSEEAKGVLKP